MRHIQINTEKIVLINSFRLNRLIIKNLTYSGFIARIYISSELVPSHLFEQLLQYAIKATNEEISLVY